MNGMSLPNEPKHNIRIASHLRGQVNGIICGELEFSKCFRVDDPNAISRPVGVDRLPGEPLPVRLDNCPGWKTLASGKSFESLDSAARARQGAHVLAAHLESQPVEKWPVVRCADARYKYAGGDICSQELLDANQFQSLYLRFDRQVTAVPCAPMAIPEDAFSDQLVSDTETAAPRVPLRPQNLARRRLDVVESQVLQSGKTASSHAIKVPGDAGLAAIAKAYDIGIH